MNFREFKESGLRNSWIEEPGLELYVRRNDLKYHPIEYTFANINATHPGHGTFTRFIDEVLKTDDIIIENVINPRFERYLKERYWTHLKRPGGDGGVRSYYMLKHVGVANKP